MKKLLFAIPVLGLLFSSCSSISFGYDYDRNSEFAGYKTYKISEDSYQLPVDELNRDRIIRAVETEMGNEGFTKSDSPDVIIDIQIKAHEEVQANATSSGVYGGRYYYGGGFTTTDITYTKYVVGTLFVNMVDAKTEKIAWQGRATKTLEENLSPEKREANINYAVRGIFTKYPPYIRK
jgi:hypothetical protein